MTFTATPSSALNGCAPSGLCECVWMGTHLPVLALVDALRVGPGKAALAVEGRDGGAELGHGVQVGGEVVQHGDHVGGKSRPLGPLLGHPVHLDKQGQNVYGRHGIFAFWPPSNLGHIRFSIHSPNGVKKERRSKVQETGRSQHFHHDVSEPLAERKQKGGRIILSPNCLDQHQG